MERAESRDPELDIARECKVVDKNLLATARSRLQTTLQEADICDGSSSGNSMAAIDAQIDAAEASAKRHDAVTKKMAEMKAEETARAKAAGKGGNGAWKGGNDWKGAGNGGNGRAERAQNWKKGGKSGDQWSQKQWNGKGKGYGDNGGYGGRGGHEERQPLKRKKY